MTAKILVVDDELDLEENDRGGNAAFVIHQWSFPCRP